MSEESPGREEQSASPSLRDPVISPFLGLLVLYFQGTTEHLHFLKLNPPYSQRQNQRRRENLSEESWKPRTSDRRQWMPKKKSLTLMCSMLIIVMINFLSLSSSNWVSTMSNSSVTTYTMIRSVNLDNLWKCWGCFSNTTST